MRYANITPSFNWDWFEHRGTARGIFSSASGSQLAARESWNLACLQVLSVALPRPTFSRPAPDHSQTSLFSPGGPEEQTFSVSWLVILPNSTRQSCRLGYTVQHLPGPGFDMVWEKPPQPLNQARGTATDPCWAPLLSKKHWWCKSREKQQEL